MAIFGRNEKIGVMPQNIQNRILSILQGHGTTDNGFYEKYNLIDKALYNLNLECQMEYRFPFTDAVFTLTRKIVNENGEKYGGIYITLTVGEKEYEFARDKSANLYGESLKFEQILRDNKLSFAPQVKQEFIDELVKAKPNDYLTFNGRFGLTCTSRNGNTTTFRKMFEGDLASLKKDDFMSSAKFTVDKNSTSLDAQYTYGMAYNWWTPLT